jgi:tetratricopeptide (TPR) repeat protein
MVFGAQSATGVPRRQRPSFGSVCARASASTWALGRALRGFLTTALLALPALFLARSAHAQTTARFADAPAAVAPPASATSATQPSAVAAIAAASAPPPAAAPPLLASASGADAPSPATSQAGFTRRLAQSHFERAALYESRGDIAQALREYSETISIDSTLGDAYLRLGMLRERMGDAREADLVYSIAVQLTDTRSKALLQRSHLRRAAGLGAQALSDLEAAAELDSSSGVLEELARDYVELHAWSAALAVFRRIAANAAENADPATLETAHLEVRALRVLAAETDPTQEQPQKHDWIGRALRSIARR